MFSFHWAWNPFNALNELNDNFGILMKNQEALNDTVRTHASVLSMLQKLLNEPEVNSRERRPSDGLETVEQLNRLVEELKASVSIQLQQLEGFQAQWNENVR